MYINAILNIMFRFRLYCLILCNNWYINFGINRQLKLPKYVEYIDESSYGELILI